MKTHYWHAAAIAFALLVTTGVLAQGHTQFDDHDRQVTNDWYNQHKSHPPRAFDSKIASRPNRSRGSDQGSPSAETFADRLTTYRRT